MGKDKGFGGSEELVNPLESEICGPVSAMALPPSFNNTPVVSICLKNSGFGALSDDKAFKELETNGLSPTNISAVCLPPRNEAPCLPSAFNDDANPGGQACIQEGSKVEYFRRTQDSSRVGWLGETKLPPFKVVSCLDGWGMFSERIVTV